MLRAVRHPCDIALNRRFEPVTIDGASHRAADGPDRGGDERWADDFREAMLALEWRRVKLEVNRRKLADASCTHEARLSNLVSGQCAPSYRDLHNIDLALDWLAQHPAPGRGHGQHVRPGHTVLPPGTLAPATLPARARGRAARGPAGRRRTPIRPPPAPWRAEALADALGRLHPALPAPPVPRNLPAAVQTWRQRHGVSEGRLAALLADGTTEAEVRLLEAGRVAPRHAALVRLRDVLRAGAPRRGESSEETSQLSSATGMGTAGWTGTSSIAPQGRGAVTRWRRGPGPTAALAAPAGAAATGGSAAAHVRRRKQPAPVRAL